ncbi:hypothetical protein HYV86_07380 [Candidatus Woesearchaeota archaeon]|nr:hypothetical protein [Candidatus Woesearchaeota archaeon]
MPIVKSALFDLDGSLANYVKAMERDMEKYSNLSPPYPVYWKEDLPPYVGNLINLIRLRPGWWEELEPIEDGFRILDASIQIGFEIDILTRAPRHMPHAAAEKLRWCEKHIAPRDEAYGSHISTRKGAVHGRVFYDDFPEFMDSWLEHRPRGLGIMPVNRFNESYRHPQVVRWDGTNFDDVCDRLQQAYSR